MNRRWDSMPFEPYRSAKVVLIKSLSELHPGTGRGTEIVDLAIQRDSIGFPVIYSSSIKGSIKTALYHRNKDLIYLLGPEQGDAEKYSSPIAVMTSLLISFPVRSLKGIYTNVTCPLLLRRFARYLSMASILNGKYDEIAKKVGKIASIPGKFPATEGFSDRHVIEGLEKAVLCEEVYVAKDLIDERNEVNELRDLIGLDSSESLISLRDDDAKGLMDRSLIRITRIRIDRDRKTVEGGGLWTEEAVPAGAVFATVFLGYSKEYLKWDKLSKLKEYLGDREPLDVVLDNVRYLIIGGDETIGRGIVELKEV
jgi:CRISPR-associated protein Cmr4